MELDLAYYPNSPKEVTPRALQTISYTFQKKKKKKIHACLKKKSFTLGWMLTKCRIKKLLYFLNFRMDADLVYLLHFLNPNVK